MKPYIVIMTAVAVSVGYFSALFFNTPHPLQLEGTPWCLHGHYTNLKHFSASEGPPDVLIDITNRGVTVYTKCTP